MTPTNPITEAREAAKVLSGIANTECNAARMVDAITTALDLAETQAAEIERLNHDVQDLQDIAKIRNEQHAAIVDALKAKLAKAEEVIKPIGEHYLSDQSLTEPLTIKLVIAASQFTKGEEG